MARKRLLSSLGILVGVSLMLSGCASTPAASSPPSGASTSNTSNTSRNSTASSSSRSSRPKKPANPGGAINALCPTSGIPINRKVSTAGYGGHKIGFCSHRCEAAWNNWGKAKRDAFVARNK